MCWMTTESFRPRQKFAINHTTCTGRDVNEICYRLEFTTLQRHWVHLLSGQDTRSPPQ